jgi:hypothetical protein
LAPKKKISTAKLDYFDTQICSIPPVNLLSTKNDVTAPNKIFGAPQKILVSTNTSHFHSHRSSAGKFSQTFFV